MRGNQAGKTKCCFSKITYIRGLIASFNQRVLHTPSEVIRHLNSPFHVSRKPGFCGVTGLIWQVQLPAGQHLLPFKPALQTQHACAPWNRPNPPTKKLNTVGSSVHGIFQAWLLEWVAISFSRGSSRPRDQTQVSRIVADALPSELPGKPLNSPTRGQTHTICSGRMKS